MAKTDWMESVELAIVLTRKATARELMDGRKIVDRLLADSQEDQWMDILALTAVHLFSDSVKYVMSSQEAGEYLAMAIASGHATAVERGVQEVRTRFAKSPERARVPLMAARKATADAAAAEAELARQQKEEKLAAQLKEAGLAPNAKGSHRGAAAPPQSAPSWGTMTPSTSSHTAAPQIALQEALAGEIYSNALLQEARHQNVDLAKHLKSLQEAKASSEAYLAQQIAEGIQVEEYAEQVVNEVNTENDKLREQIAALESRPTLSTIRQREEAFAGENERLKAQVDSRPTYSTMRKREDQVSAEVQQAANWQATQIERLEAEVKRLKKSKKSKKREDDDSSEEDSSASDEEEDQFLKILQTPSLWAKNEIDNLREELTRYFLDPMARRQDDWAREVVETLLESLVEWHYEASSPRVATKIMDTVVRMSAYGQGAKPAELTHAAFGIKAREGSKRYAKFTKAIAGAKLRPNQPVPVQRRPQSEPRPHYEARPHFERAQSPPAYQKPAPKKP